LFQAIEERPMRAFIAAAMAFILLTLPAYAQRGGGKRHKEPAQNGGQKKPKVDEKAYKGALDSIPEKKADPWGKMR
jgi:hypothetical protein